MREAWADNVDQSESSRKSPARAIRFALTSPRRHVDRLRPQFDLRGMRAAVLGATSGIGRAAALALAEAGADVIVHGRRSIRAAEELARELRSRGVRAQALMADLADRDAGDRLVEDAWNALGRPRRLAAHRRRRHPDRREREALLRRQARPALVGRRRRHDPPLPRSRSEDEVPGPRVDPDHGLGPGRDGHGGRLGRALRGDQGRDHGLHPQPGAQPGPPGPRQRPRPGLDQDRVGRDRFRSWQDRVLRETPLSRWGTPEDVAQRRPASSSAPPRNS